MGEFGGIGIRGAGLLAQQRTLWERLDPDTRMRLFLALLGLVVLAIGMMALIWLAGRWARRYATGLDRTPRRTDSAGDDDWWRKRLVGDALGTEGPAADRPPRRDDAPPPPNDENP